MINKGICVDQASNELSYRDKKALAANLPQVPF